MYKVKKNMLVADNSELSRIVLKEIFGDDFCVFEAKDGAEALSCFETYSPQAVLLDVMMPKEDGYEVCRKIRSKSSVPIILITARGEDFERIMGLDIGADDYIVKPFSPSEVMARLRAVLRRVNTNTSQTNTGNQVSIADLTINLDEYVLTIQGKKMSLTKREIETMWTLANNPNKVFTRDNLLDSLWGFDYFGDSRTVDSHIKRLRAKLDKVEHPKWSIKTIWGVGYKFDVEE